MKFPWTEEKIEVVDEPIIPVAVEPATAVAVAEPETVKVPAPMPQSGPARKPRIDGDEMEEYKRISAEIGIDCCTDLVREKLLTCLREENIHVFNHDQVVAFLDDNLGTDWEWRGLRSIDTEHMPGGSWGYQNDGQRRISFSAEPYRGAVPLPVLLTVQKIQRAAPEVFFYVSSRKNHDGDPFLLVTSRWVGRYIVERWDEPNFRER